jgi:hypothetical protein
VLPDELDRAPGTVNVILLSREGCPYCHIVRRNYLQPLAAQQRDGIRVVEIRMDSERSLRDFSGRTTTHGQFARAHGARFAPTVLFLGSDGRELAGRIVGLSEDFFGAYLEAALQAASLAVRQAPGSSSGRTLPGKAGS